MATEYRVAVIGYGLAGSAFHAPFVAATDGLRVSAVVTGNAERQHQVRERYPDSAVLSTVEELWADAGSYDLVVVASPNRFHVEHATTALEHDLAVVVDKPVAGTGAEIRALAEQRERMLTVFQNRRYDGDFRTIRQLFADGALTGVSRFESRFERSSTPKASTSWKTSTDPADLAHILYDLGSHLVDQAIVLFGPPTSVFAQACSPRADVPVEEDATVLLTHAGGVHSVLRMSNAVVPVAPRFAVLGETAGFRCWGLDPQERASRAGRLPTEQAFGAYPSEQWGQLVTAREVTSVPTMDGDYLGYWQAVLACLRGDGPPPVRPEESILLVDTIDTAVRSLREGHPIAV